MLSGCSSLTNIKELKNWNVSNRTNFSYMFYECSSLTDIKWNIKFDKKEKNFGNIDFI